MGQGHWGKVKAVNSKCVDEFLSVRALWDSGVNVRLQLAAQVRRGNAEPGTWYKGLSSHS